MQFQQACHRLCVSSLLIFIKAKDLQSGLDRRKNNPNLPFSNGDHTVFVAFPAPLLFGLAIDNTCLIKDMSCGTEGRCLVYDRNSFRFTLHGLALGVKTAAVICYIIGFIFSRMDRYDIELNEDKMEMQKKKDPDLQEHLLKHDVRNGD